MRTWVQLANQATNSWLSHRLACHLEHSPVITISIDSRRRQHVITYSTRKSCRSMLVISDLIIHIRRLAARACTPSIASPNRDAQSYGRGRGIRLLKSSCPTTANPKSPTCEGFCSPERELCQDGCNGDRAAANAFHDESYLADSSIEQSSAIFVLPIISRTRSPMFGVSIVCRMPAIAWHQCGVRIGFSSLILTFRAHRDSRPHDHTTTPPT